LILQAVETCGREWRSVAQFMRKHAEVLGKAEDYHENINKQTTMEEMTMKTWMDEMTRKHQNDF